MAKLYGLMRLGRDAEIRRTPGGDAVCNLSLAYNYGQKPEGGERPTQWIDASLWGKRAESLAEFLTKGSLHLFTLSDVHIETYTDKEGYEAFKLAGRVDDVELGPRKEGAPSGGTQGSASGAQRRPYGGAAPSPSPAPAAAGQSSIDDGDVPF